MKKYSEINEGVFSDILKRDTGDEIRKEDEHIKENPWYQNIQLENPVKYKKDELSFLDMAYAFIARLKKSLNATNVEQITFFFRHENWYLRFNHFTGYGNDTYNMRIHGDKGYNTLRWADLSMDEKRSIKQRLETFRLYGYSIGNGEYVVMETRNFQGKTGTLISI